MALIKNLVLYLPTYCYFNYRYNNNNDYNNNQDDDEDDKDDHLVHVVIEVHLSTYSLLLFVTCYTS